MNAKLHLFKWLKWFVTGGLFGTYILPYVFVSNLSTSAAEVILEYPAALYLPLIVFLFVISLNPAIQFWRRYRRNWLKRPPPFTLVEGLVAFSLGVLASVLPGLGLLIPNRVSSNLVHAVVLWGVSLTVFILTVASLSKREALSVTTRLPEHDPLIDSAISDERHDTLNREPFVRDLYEIIRDFPSKEPYVIGLNGSWGAGKTSVLNLLRNHLVQDGKIVLVDFNPWFFSSTESLIHNFYAAIANAINSQFFYPDLKSIAKRYAKLLAPMTRQYGFEITASSASVETLKKRIESYIEATGRRIVIVIDDIDRLQPSELLSVFANIKLAATFANTLFLLAYDESEIKNMLEGLKLPMDFFDKIVQHPIQLPAIEQSEIDRFLLYSDKNHRSHLDLLLDKVGLEEKRRSEFDKEIVVFYPKALRPLFPTLRAAKRFLNGLIARFPPIKNEVHLLDFVLLEVLRVFAYKVYQDVWVNRYFYIPAWAWRDSYASPFDMFSDEGKYPTIRKHVDSLLEGEKHKENIIEILRKIFFVNIEGAFGKPVNYDAVADTHRGQKRLTHSECFDKYFMLAVPRSALPDASVEAELKSWHEAGDPESEILETIKNFKEQERLGDFLDRLVIFLGKVDEKLADPLLNVFSKNIEMFSREGDFSEQNIAFRTLLSVLNDKVPDSKKTSRTERLISEIAAIDVAVQLVGAVMSNQTGSFYKLQQAVDLGAAKRKLVERFKHDYVDLGADIFEKSPIRPTYVLHQIGISSEEGKHTINDYVISLCQHKPERIGDLISTYLWEAPGEDPSLRYKELAAIYDVARLAALAREAGKGAWSNKAGEAAVAQFLETFEKSRNQDDNTNPPPSSQS